jgi:hypothetical protein
MDSNRGTKRQIKKNPIGHYTTKLWMKKRPKLPVLQQLPISLEIQVIVKVDHAKIYLVTFLQFYIFSNGT